MARAGEPAEAVVRDLERASRSRSASACSRRRGASFDLTPWRWAYVALVGGKLADQLARVARRSRRDRAVMATQALNTIADVVLLTAAIYFTGGPYSPLLATYVIVIAVLSLLSNLGVTILITCAPAHRGRPGSRQYSKSA